MTRHLPRHPRVKLYCRADAAPPARRRQRSVRDRLSALARAGRVAAVEVETWPRAVPLSGTDPLDPHADARDAYATFEAWADRTGASLSPFFGRRERYILDDPSAATPECLLPVVGLTVHDGEEVVAAYPHTADGDHREVDDALAALESDPVGPSVDAQGDPGTGQGSTAD
jgi:hypothetical protein